MFKAGDPHWVAGFAMQAPLGRFEAARGSGRNQRLADPTQRLSQDGNQCAWLGCRSADAERAAGDPDSPVESRATGRMSGAMPRLSHRLQIVLVGVAGIVALEVLGYVGLFAWLTLVGGVAGAN